MQKDIKFSMKFDTSDFDRSIERMQQKLKEMTGLSKGPAAGQPGAQQGVGSFTGGESLLNKPAMEHFYKSMHAMRNNMNTAMNSHAKEQMKFMKEIAKEEEKRNKLLKDQDNFSKSKTKDLKEELRIKKELKNTDEQIYRLQSGAATSRTSFQAARGVLTGQTMPVFVTNWPFAAGTPGSTEGMMGAMGGGPRGPHVRPPSGKGGAFWTSLATSLGLAGGLLATGATLIDQYTSLPITRTAALGKTTQSIVGNQLQEIARGDVISTMAWQPERRKALMMAEQKFHSEQLTTPMNVLSGAMGLVKGIFTGGGAGQNASSNYLMGAITKGLEKEATLGHLLPANRLSKALGNISQRYFSTEQAQLMENFGQNFTKMMQAQKEENPLKNLAVNYFQGRYRSDLQAQRMMGLGDTGYYGRGGFLERANLAGFTGDMALEQARAIQAAGGSTRAMRGNAILGLQAARGFNLTNAGSILGTISGGAGSSEASQRIFEQILEEGVKEGLDKSEAVEELRRFSQQTAEIVARTGATSAADVQRLIQGFGRFQAGGIPTIRQQAGAMEAYKEYQGLTAKTSGRAGTLQYAAMVKSGLGGKLSAREIGGLMEIPEQDITTTNPFIQAMASEAGMKPEELVRQIINSKRESIQATAGMRPEWQQTLQKAGITKQLSYAHLQRLKHSKNPADQRIYRAYMGVEAAEPYLFGYQSVQKRSAAVRGLLTMGTTGAGHPMAEPTAPAVTSEVEKRLAAAPGTRAADEVIRSTGVAAQAMLENFREFKTQITPASDALDTFTKKIIILTDILQRTPEKDRAAVSTYVAEHAYANVQPQAGKPKPGGR